jgi:hypothetical protein
MLEIWKVSRAILDAGDSWAIPAPQGSSLIGSAWSATALFAQVPPLKVVLSATVRANRRRIVVRRLPFLSFCPPENPRRIAPQSAFSAVFFGRLRVFAPPV